MEREYILAAPISPPGAEMSAQLIRLPAMLALAAVMLLGAAAMPADGANAPPPIKIGIIGAGKIGGTLATLWLKPLAQSLGPRAHVGTPREAAVFGDVVLISIPYGALPQLGQDLKSELAGKIVLDTGNPYPERDGEMALEARRKGTGVASAEFLPGVRLVRAFNAINYKSLQSEAHRAGEPVAIPLAGDDAAALAVASELVKDAGFEPVVVGPLSSAKLFDVGSPVYVQVLTAKELRARLGL
jgi:8-hydroxy-5-deazaflavin:NADPH oxidoreductase